MSDRLNKIKRNFLLLTSLPTKAFRNIFAGIIYLPTIIESASIFKKNSVIKMLATDLCGRKISND